VTSFTNTQTDVDTLGEEYRYNAFVQQTQHEVSDIYIVTRHSYFLLRHLRSRRLRYTGARRSLGPDDTIGLDVVNEVALERLEV